MALRPRSKLDPRKRYVQIALNSTLSEARSIIASLPVSDRIILEAGTPLIKAEGARAIANIRAWYQARFLVTSRTAAVSTPLSSLGIWSFLDWGIVTPKTSTIEETADLKQPYVVADMKMMDRGATEVEIAARAGADGVIALGAAPTESLNAFVETCEAHQVDAMIDMMNVEYPLAVLRQLKKLPAVVILHRGVDEEHFNKEKQIPLHEIRRIKGSMNVMIAIAGGDTLREVQRAVFNDADIVVVWKSFYQKSHQTAELAAQFLKEIK